MCVFFIAPLSPPISGMISTYPTSQPTGAPPPGPMGRHRFAPWLWISFRKLPRHRPARWWHPKCRAPHRSGWRCDRPSTRPGSLGLERKLHPGRLTAGTYKSPQLWERKMIFQSSMIMFHVNLQERMPPMWNAYRSLGSFWQKQHGTSAVPRWVLQNISPGFAWRKAVRKIGGFPNWTVCLSGETHHTTPWNHSSRTIY